VLKPTKGTTNGGIINPDEVHPQPSHAQRHPSIHPSIHWWVVVQSGHHHVGQESGGPEIPSPVQK